MASLTHVCMWTEHGWKKITANEAARLHPGGTVLAASGLFICELCRQYVILTEGERNVRHFRHKVSELSKDCPDRTFGSSASMTFEAREYELPIRICNITGNQFDLELGLLYVPAVILQEQKIQQVIIQPIGVQDNQYVYSFKRLNEERLTYVYIGNIPAPNYKLITDDALRSFWPKYVKGIDHSGSLFVEKSGKKLPDDADVQVGNSYLLLCTKRICPGSTDIEIRKICEKSASKCTWYIYKVKANVFSEDAAQFFWSLHCRLTESRLFLNPIWPICIKTPYVIEHDRAQFFIHVYGGDDIVEKAFPVTTIKRFSCPDKTGKVIRMDCNGRQQLISVGRTKVLEYTYFWRKQLNSTTPAPVVVISDIHGNILSSDVQYELPIKQIMCVSAEYDGTVVILEDGIVHERRMLKASSKIEIENIHFGTEIKVMQGLDIVQTVRFKRKISEISTYDFDIARRLMSFHGKLIPIAHRIGAVTVQLEQYPEVKKWLCKKIRDGYMPEDAFYYFKYFMTKLQFKR
ncbi:hypothetical protein AALB53_16955 [Lachnospiraceae bacterium 47-T17]